MNDTPVTGAFKRAFVERMAAHGFTPSMVEERLTKQAVVGAGGLWKAIGGLGSAAKTTLGIAMATPVVMGGALGYGMGNIEGVEPPDIKALKEEERINNIRRAIKALKRQQGVVI